MSAPRVPHRLRWLRPWLRRGYTVEFAGSGHLKVRAPGGEYVASVSNSPRDPDAARFETTRLLRRHEESSRGGDERGGEDE